MKSLLYLGVLLGTYIAVASAGCCSMKYKSCDGTWCGSTETACLSCSNPGMAWLENGALDSTCRERWTGCSGNDCCPGLTCRADASGWKQCLTNYDAPVISNPTAAATPRPTLKPVASPTKQPTPAPTPAPVVSPTKRPTAAPTKAPVASPTLKPTPAPTKAPVASPTMKPTPSPTKAPVTSPTASGTGCCSLNYLDCDVSWCGSTQATCQSCSGGVLWLANGALATGTCLPRWYGCASDPSGCCNGATCRDNGKGFKQCLANSDDPVIGSPVSSPTPKPASPVATPAPTARPTARPTASPISTPTPKPTALPTKAPTPTAPTSSTLLSTTKAMNAWDVFKALESLTQNNNDSPATSALLAEGGAAGSGYVVSESQSYALLITGTVLASWDEHAGKVSGSSRSEVITKFGRYFSFWQKMCQNSYNSGTNCQSTGYICQDSTRSGLKSVCLPDWKSYADGSGSVGSGPAPDGDEDAIVGIILAVKAVENDASKPSWYNDARKWADASATAFFTFNVNKDYSGYRLVKLGACWGGWGSSGNNPSYHSPGSYKIMRDYQMSFPASDRSGYSGISETDWNKLISTSYEYFRAVQVGNNGAMVPNWATVDVSGGSIVHTGGSFSGSGTPQNEYGAEAARTTFRVALDAAFYPTESADWEDYLTPYLVRLRAGYTGSYPYWSTGTFPNGIIPKTSLQVYMFGSWLNNGFIFGPTLSSLIVGDSTDKAMIDAAGSLLSSSLPTSYYPRCWVLISSLMLNGAMESAGKTFHS